jgi:dCMP deaminase
MYVHGLPTCSECAKGIIQAGVKKVVSRHSLRRAEPTRGDAPPSSGMLGHWVESNQLSDLMFREAGVIHTSIET